MVLKWFRKYNKFHQADDVSKYIILYMLKKNPIKQSDLIKGIMDKYDYSKPTVISRIKYLMKKGVILTRDYGVKSPKLYLNRDKIILTYDFYYYSLIYLAVILSLTTSTLLSFILKTYSIFYGSFISAIIILISCLLDVITNDKTKIILLKV